LGSPGSSVARAASMVFGGSMVWNAEGGGAGTEAGNGVP